MICPSCQHACSDRERQCSGCGQEFLRACSICNRALRAGATRCDECGARIATSSPPPTAESAPGPVVAAPAASVLSPADEEPAKPPAWTEPTRAARLRKVATAIGAPFDEAIESALEAPGGERAATCWRTVLDEARKRPNDLDAADLACVACVALIAHGRETGRDTRHDARALFDTGRTLAAGGGNRDASLELAVEYSKTLVVHGETAEAHEIARDAFRASEGDEDPGILARVRLAHAELLAITGRAGELLRVTNPTATETRSETVHGPAASRLLAELGLQHAWGLLLGGQLAEADRLLGRSSEALDAAGYPELASRARALRRFAAGLSGDPSIARAALEAGHERLPRPGSILPDLARLECQLVIGEADSILAETRASADLAPGRDDLRKGWQLSYRAESLLAKGQTEAALRCARGATELCGPRQLAFPLIRSHGVAARALLRTRGSRARNAVLDELASADENIERTGCVTLSPALEEWRAELVTALGDLHAGDHRRREASRLYASIGASGHARRLAGPRAAGTT